MLLLILGLLFMLQAVIIFCAVAWFAGTIGRVLASRPAVARRLDILTAGVFASLGIRLALAQR